MYLDADVPSPFWNERAARLITDFTWGKERLTLIIANAAATDMAQIKLEIDHNTGQVSLITPLTNNFKP